LTAKQIPDEVKVQVNEIVARFNEGSNNPTCYYVVRFRGLSGVAANRAWTRAYVVNFGSGVLSRVDIDPTSATFRQATPIAGGLSGPRDVVLNSAEDAAYVTEQNGGRLVRVDVNPASPDYRDVTTITASLGGPCSRPPI